MSKHESKLKHNYLHSFRKKKKLNKINKDIGKPRHLFFF